MNVLTLIAGTSFITGKVVVGFKFTQSNCVLTIQRDVERQEASKTLFSFLFVLGKKKGI